MLNTCTYIIYMYISKEGSTSIRIDVFFRGVGGSGLFFNVVIFFLFCIANGQIKSIQRNLNTGQN